MIRGNKASKSGSTYSSSVEYLYCCQNVSEHADLKARLLMCPGMDHWTTSWTGSMIFLDDPGPVQHVGTTVWINCSSSLRTSDRSGLAVERMDFFIAVWLSLTLTLNYSSSYRYLYCCTTCFGARHTISGQRNCLKNATFEMWVYLKFIS